MASTSACAPHLEEAYAHELEGIVSKRLDALYRSGEGDWIKVKTAICREANKDRGQVFEKKW
jgi:ATP-dependent DNA ligase